MRGRGINVKGIIEGTEVTLYNSYVRKTSFVLRSATCMESYSATICPDKIVIGISSLTGIQVKEIEATLLPLNRFFVEAPVLFEGPTKDDPTFLKYNQSKNLKAEDDLKEIECVNDISVKHSVNEFIVQFEPLGICIFKKSLELSKAITEFASLRNLFTFLGDRCVPLREFLVVVEGNIRCQVLLNFSDPSDNQTSPFVISSAVIADNFETIWDRWINFYHKSHSITTLFFEIICNRSTGINYFLNLTQSLEIYSRQYREKEAQKVRERLKEKSLTLRHRFIDLLEDTNCILNIASDKIKQLAANIADARNYYTHYDSGKFNMPSFNFLDSASLLLRCLLLCIVYRIIGISDNDIKDRLLKHQQYVSVDCSITDILNEKIRKK